MPTPRRCVLPVVALLSLLACAGKVDPYRAAAPPKAPVPQQLDAATWQSHYVLDLQPFWVMPEAKGTPLGNFPTHRTMDGSLASPASRKPRMLGRQVFTYSIGYLLTGDEALLDLARAGNRWLLDHARDQQRGGWYADLDAAGAPLGDNDKLAQDYSYAVMGPASFFFVTADAESEAAVLATRDLLFDPGKYWDSAHGRIKDGMNGALTAEAYMGPQGSWELVAQLDPITAFLLLVQPVLTDGARQAQVLGDLRTLALRIHDSFWKDGIFWGSTGAIGTYSSSHTDFGHILKAYWALLQIDKRLDDHPLQDFLAQRAPATLAFAYDSKNGRWGKKPFNDHIAYYGSDWWAYAESDQLAATLSLHDPSWIAVVRQTAPNFLNDYVDRTRSSRELVPSTNRDGTWAYHWGAGDKSKCNEWKNGFHGAEHALVMTLFGHWLEGTEAPLYFAFPADKVAVLAANARPYTFQGHVAGYEDLGPLASDPTRHKVRVRFDQLR